MDLVSIIIADIVAISVVVVAAACFDLWTPPARLRRLGGRFHARLRPRTPPVPAAVPAHRPIEQVAEHARRLHDRFHHPPPEGRSYAKHEAIRRAYDQVLAEGCQRLGIDHLLGVLPPGEELDAERTRVERRLEISGLALHPTR
jgi:hypothetical protein